MKWQLGVINSDFPLIDLLSGQRQVFQGKVPNIEEFLTHRNDYAAPLLIPHDAKFWNRAYSNYVEEQSYKRQILIFNRSDFAHRVNVKNAVIVQNSLKRTAHDLKIILFPYNVQPLTHLPFRTYNNSPSVSFVGYVPRLSLNRLFKSLAEDPMHPLRSNGALVRRIGLKHLQNSNLQKTIKIRSHYGGAQSLISNIDSFRTEFIQSMITSDLVYTPRGDANSSQRFFEAVSAGRIPLIPDTKILIPGSPSMRNFLPFPSVALNSFSNNLEKAVVSFWSKLDTVSFNEIQLTLRSSYMACFHYPDYVHKIMSIRDFENLDSFSPIPLQQL